MKHDFFQELLALRLYDEITRAEQERLDSHLSSCEACRSFEAQLAKGLGRILDSTSPRDTPAIWLHELQARVLREEELPYVHSHRPLMASFTSGLAAGLGAAFLGLAGWRALESKPPVPLQAERPLQEFARSEPPPLAAGCGQLAHLILSLQEKGR